MKEHHVHRSRIIYLNFTEINSTFTGKADSVEKSNEHFCGVVTRKKWREEVRKRDISRSLFLTGAFIGGGRR
jgi:hypothetical protein